MAEFIVGAASSLTEVLTEAGKAFEKANPGTHVRFSFAASGVLLQQARQGAPIDVFVSASPKELDTLEKERKLVPGSRKNVAGNSLVLIAPKASGLKDWKELASPKIIRVAISNPEFVPSGRYAKETLTRRGLWNAVAPKAVLGQNVRQTLAYVAGGDVPAGIVFATDARLEKRVRVVSMAVSGKDHSPIVYSAATLSSSTQSALSQRFLTFLSSPAGRAIFTHFGFR
ncbi:MAG: molybdate ABC transporter substrate-binding protein [Armatimonas sp.]